jgi:hypothetical protein
MGRGGGRLGLQLVRRDVAVVKVESASSPNPPGSISRFRDKSRRPDSNRGPLQLTQLYQTIRVRRPYGEALGSSSVLARRSPVGRRGTGVGLPLLAPPQKAWEGGQEPKSRLPDSNRGPSFGTSPRDPRLGANSPTRSARRTQSARPAARLYRKALPRSAMTSNWNRSSRDSANSTRDRRPRRDVSVTALFPHLRGRLAEVPPVGGDDEKNTASGQRKARNDCPSGAKSQLRNLCGDKPNPGEHDQQEPDFGEAYTCVIRQPDDEVHTQHSMPLVRRRTFCSSGPTVVHDASSRRTPGESMLNEWPPNSLRRAGHRARSARHAARPFSPARLRVSLAAQPQPPRA